MSDDKYNIEFKEASRFTFTFNKTVAKHLFMEWNFLEIKINCEKNSIQFNWNGINTKLKVVFVILKQNTKKWKKKVKVNTYKNKLEQKYSKMKQRKKKNITS